MNHAQLVEELKGLEFFELRVEETRLFEFVIRNSCLDALNAVLARYFGPPFKPAGEKPKKEAQQAAAPWGGIRQNQAMYLAEDGGISYCALIWPWGDGKLSTVKIARISS
jgi:hypothetical protein